jgi:cation diffusion facilitator CzcD-associated flavoprotein CzcO
VEHFDVLVVGAGLSGIGAAHHLQVQCPWATYAVLEARGAIGGTWDLFRYPGIRSDSDMFTLGYSLRPWDKPETIADGASIRQYIRDTARDTGIERHIRFHHKIVGVEWSTGDARWTVTAERSDPDGPEGAAPEVVQLTADFVFACTGYYRYDHGHLPDFAGMADFGGTLVHPQAWPEDLDYAGKRIVVVGSGATAITLIPSLAETAGHVTMLQRSPTYIASLPATNPVPALLRRILPDRYASGAVRWMNAVGTQASYQLSKRRPGLVKKVLLSGVKRQLPEGYDLRHFTPTYNPWDQRLCVVPDGDLFKAISAGKASVVTDHIDTFTETGIRLKSGDELEADIIVTATGLELLFLGGMSVTVDGEAVDISQRLTYKGMMLEGVPNFALAVGYTNASWTLKADLTADTVCRILNHMRAVGLRQATAVNTDTELVEMPLLSLQSGYIQRAAHLSPKQGTKFPWQVYQSYVKDYRAMKRSPVVDDVMVYSNPAPAVAGSPEPAAERVAAAAS